MATLTINIPTPAALRIKAALETSGWTGTNEEAIIKVKELLIVYLRRYVRTIETEAIEQAANEAFTDLEDIT